MRSWLLVRKLASSQMEQTVWTLWLWLVPLAPSPQPEAIQEPPNTGHLISGQKDTYHLGHSKGFRSYVLGKESRDQMYFLLCHTAFVF